MGLAFESQRNHIKKAVSSEGTAFFMEIFKKDLSISGAMEFLQSVLQKYWNATEPGL